MARFFNPEGNDLRLHAPATARNRDVILEVLKPALPASGLIFEVASGTGEHAAHMAPQLSDHVWQPSDIDEHHLRSIEAWREETGVNNLLPARHFDVLTHQFDSAHEIAAILAINLIHISPWVVAETLIEKAGNTITSGNILYLYGPYRRNGAHTSESNEQFDHSLKSRDPSWGVRDMEAVIELAEKAGFTAPEITPMPANNFSLVFRKK